MKSWRKGSLLAGILFLLLWVILTLGIGIPEGYQIVRAIPKALPLALSLMIPTLVALIYGFKILETPKKKKIIWKMPLVAFITTIILLFIGLLYSLISCFIFKVCPEALGYALIFLPLFGWLYGFEIAAGNFMLALILYFIYRKKR